MRNQKTLQIGATELSKLNNGISPEIIDDILSENHRTVEIILYYKKTVIKRYIMDPRITYAKPHKNIEALAEFKNQIKA